MLLRASIARSGLPSVLAFTLAACAGTPGDGPTGTSQQAILGGTTVTATDSPILYLRGPQGACTATLIAPNMVVTARHCVADTPDGQFSCTSSGDLVMTGSGAGQIGVDDPPSQLNFYANARAVAGTTFQGSPDAVGASIISTNTTTACKDDIAFVILAQPITTLTPASIRIGPTSFGESVSAWGYGLTTDPRDPFALRVRNNAVVEGVGSDNPSSGTQLAPIRAVRIGPDDVTCNGDSGGPMMSNTTGAIIAIASLGDEANTTSPSCTQGNTPDTTGPRLGAYQSLIALAFRTAGATPILEPGSTPLPTFDAGSDASSATDAAVIDEGGSEVTPKNIPPDGPMPYRATGGGCSATPGARDGSATMWIVALLASIAAARTMSPRLRRVRMPRPSRRR